MPSSSNPTRPKLTAERKAEVYRRLDLIERLTNDLDWRKLTLAQLEAIAAMIDGEGKK